MAFQEQLEIGGGAPKPLTLWERVKLFLNPLPRQHASCRYCDAKPPFGEDMCDECYIEHRTAP